MKRIILASGSPRRRELLGLLGIDFSIIPAKGEEVLTVSDPGQAVQELSRQKAEEVAEGIQGEALLIGADTVVALQGEILGKPDSEQGAFRMLQKLQGNVHSVFTGVTIIDRGLTGQEQCCTFVEETKVWVSALTDTQIWNYIRLGESLDKAGSYAIQGRFGAFVERIEGDYNNVVGLPLSRLYREVLKMGLDFLEEPKV